MAWPVVFCLALVGCAIENGINGGDEKSGPDNDPEALQKAQRCLAHDPSQAIPTASANDMDPDTLAAVKAWIQGHRDNMATGITALLEKHGISDQTWVDGTAQVQVLTMARQTEGFGVSEENLYGYLIVFGDDKDVSSWNAEEGEDPWSWEIGDLAAYAQSKGLDVVLCGADDNTADTTRAKLLIAQAVMIEGEVKGGFEIRYQDEGSSTSNLRVYGILDDSSDSNEIRLLSADADDSKNMLDEMGETIAKAATYMEGLTLDSAEVAFKKAIGLNQD